MHFTDHITVTNDDFRFIVEDQLKAVGVNPGSILIEPEGKNTAPAILAASLLAMKADPEGIVLVAPSDHFMPDIKSFHSASLRSGIFPMVAGPCVPRQFE